jgi:hypothetical protein
VAWRCFGWGKKGEKESSVRGFKEDLRVNVEAQGMREKVGEWATCEGEAELGVEDEYDRWGSPVG